MAPPATLVWFEMGLSRESLGLPVRQPPGVCGCAGPGTPPAKPPGSTWVGSSHTVVEVPFLLVLRTWDIFLLEGAHMLTTTAYVTLKVNESAQAQKKPVCGDQRSQVPS